MSTPATPSNPTPAGDDRNLVAVDATTAASFEDKLELFWKKNRGLVIAACVIVLLVIVGKWGWEEIAQRKHADIAKAYAAATTPEQLKAFAVANPDHTLGGIAQLRMADEAYKTGKSADAIAGYDKAIAALKKDPLAARAQIGRALAKVQSGKTADGQADLKKLLDDANELKAVRTEAGYHLTSLAVEAGNGADAQKMVDQLMQIDASSSWTQRALSVRATLPAQPAAEQAPSAAAKDAKAAPASSEKKDDASGSVQVKLPGNK